MDKKEIIKAALIYDFDGTLSPGNMQEFGFVQAIGKNKEEFWNKSNNLSTSNDASPILCYMYNMIREAEYNGISLTRKSFLDFGGKIEFFKGVEQWFSLIDSYGKSKGLELKHYIISSGLKEMIEGCAIAKYFENIYACSFLYDASNVAFWPAVAVDYTAKTQFLFKINKGISEVSDNVKINMYQKEEDRPMPFERMIYFGDGQTDIPCMKMVKVHGGHSVAVYCDKEKKKQALQLIKDDRANFACLADYTRQGELYNIVTRILDKIRADHDFKLLLRSHQDSVL